MNWLSMVDLVGLNDKMEFVLHRVFYDSQAFKLYYISNIPIRWNYASPRGYVVLLFGRDGSLPTSS
jgi:hypothetical protein